MKREIKFRGKRVGDREWVYGSYTQMREDDHNECFKTKPHKTYHIIWQWEAGDWNMGGYANYEVIPETVGQFTGLKDKNGVEIYEGDIFQNGDKVIWHDSGFVLQNKLGKFPLWQSNIEGLKVIGNIHDNPELLK